MTNPIGQRLRCPKCGKLLSVAHLTPGAWVECICKPCKHLVIFSNDNGTSKHVVVSRA